MARKAIFTFDKLDTERVLAWARYVYWADVECQQYTAYNPPEDEPPTGLSFVLMVQWYAALWVAIEGWRESRLDDPVADELLNEPAFKQNLELLRRFRNGVYHYQHTLLDDRLVGFLREGAATVPWAFLVHSEFKRVLWELAHPRTIPLTLQTELADSIRQIIGWLPSEIAEAASYNADQHYREVAAMILKDGRRNTQEARVLMAAVEQLSRAAIKSEAVWSRYKRALIDSLKRRAENT